MDWEWDDDPVGQARRAAFEKAAAWHRPGYRWLNARGTHWIEPVGQEEYERHRSGGRLRALCCEQCAGLYIGEFTPRRRYCSAECSLLAQRQRAHNQQTAPRQRSCARCGIPFVVNRARRRYCSERCRDHTSGQQP